MIILMIIIIVLMLMAITFNTVCRCSSKISLDKMLFYKSENKYKQFSLNHLDTRSLAQAVEQTTINFRLIDVNE